MLYIVIYIGIKADSAEILSEGYERIIVSNVLSELNKIFIG